MASSPLPTTMRAWQRQRRGLPSPATLTLNSTLPLPPLPARTSSDILIRISHTALQYSSATLFAAFPVLPFAAPPIPELEFTGTVVAAGENASPDVVAVGTRVIAHQSIGDVILRGRGALVEYVLLPSCQAAKLPEDALHLSARSSGPGATSAVENGAGSRTAGKAQTDDMAAMAGLLGSGSTALKMARTAGVKAGDEVLVNGASGSVGGLLVQVCKLRGARVVGVASGGNEEVVRGLGADEFIDYQLAPISTSLTSKYADRPFDIIFDCVGVQELYAHSPAYLKPEGMVINIGAMEGAMLGLLKNVFFNFFWPTWLGGIPRRYVMFSTPPTKDAAMELIRMVEKGELVVRVDSVWGMGDLVKAYERLGSGRARGRVVVRVERE